MASLSPAAKALWSLRAARTHLTGATSFTSTRLLHSSRFASNEEKSEGDEGNKEASEQDGSESEQVAAEEAPKKLPYRRRKFHMWLQAEGTRFATPTASGTNYVGAVPFPMNPLFKPTPPISNFAKDEIYRMHMQDSTKWTPRQLGTEYNISIKRVEAILRLKHLEKEMIADGFVPQDNFTAGMEQLMAVRVKRHMSIKEPLTDILPNVGSPKFEAVDEDQEFTAEDAAKVLKRRPLAEIKAKQLEEERTKPFKLVDSIKGVPKKEAAKTKTVGRNAAVSSRRFQFAISDTSSEAVLIRDKDGTLLQVEKA